MKVVEVIPGLKTDADVCKRLYDYARDMGHTAVMAQDTPGFIVNHAGRGYGTEALRILGEGVADPVTVDRIMREQVSFSGAGFKLGPFELMDLIGIDIGYAFPFAMYATLIPVILGSAFLAALGPAESAVRGSLVEALEYE